MNSLSTQEACLLLEEFKPKISDILQASNSKMFVEARAGTSELERVIDEARSRTSSSSDYLNDLFVIDKFIDFLECHTFLWENILNKRFSESWISLQNSLDCLRLIKKFSSIEVSFFEDQLIAIEGLYPYTIFSSMGLIVDRYDCSICGNDIDSFECEHIQGNLYAGVLAYGRARNILEIDHFSLVEYPKDKRCVIQYDNSSQHFRVVAELSSKVARNQISILGLCGVTTKSLKVINQEFVATERNAPCYCGSNNKFKKCCINKKFVDFTHYEFVVDPFLGSLEWVLPSNS